MFNRLPRTVLKLTHRLARPAALRRLLRQTSEMMAALPQMGATAPDQPGPAWHDSAATLLGTGVQEVAAFGANPGALRMLTYSPPTPPRMGAPLVVVLHGCGQQAERFATDAGWLALADRLGLVLLLPEQTSENNQAHCFNWFHPEDVTRGRGEVASIRQMVAEVQRGFGTARDQTYVVGLSAGGGMAAALLAAYPDVFAAGAVVAGLPVGVATDVTTALTRMSRASTERSPETLAARARHAGPAGYSGPWPRLSVWQGGHDRTVDPRNADLLVQQWTGLHGLPDAPTSQRAWPSQPIQYNGQRGGQRGGQHNGHRGGQRGGQRISRQIWGHADAPAVELWTIDEMAHGFPVDTDHAAADRWVLDAGISGAEEMARFWGLLPA